MAEEVKELMRKMRERKKRQGYKPISVWIPQETFTTLHHLKRMWRDESLAETICRAIGVLEQATTPPVVARHMPTLQAVEAHVPAEETPSPPPQPETAAKDAYDHYLLERIAPLLRAGLSLRKIAKQLNAEGIVKRTGQPWDENGKALSVLIQKKGTPEMHALVAQKRTTPAKKA